MDTRLLNGKIAVIFGAAGSIGSAVAKAFSQEGATVFLAGQSRERLDSLATHIKAGGGEAITKIVNVLDEPAVNRCLAEVSAQAGKIDIVVDLTGPLARDYGNGKLAIDLSVNEFLLPLTTMVQSRFITARAAARHMIKMRSGVIILVTGSPARPHVPGATAIGAAFGAMENLAANLAFEVGPSGVRVVCVRTLANIDSRSIQDTMKMLAQQLQITPEQLLPQFEDSNFLKTTATVKDTANAAVLVACDRARMFTGTVINASAGAALD